MNEQEKPLFYWFHGFLDSSSDDEAEDKVKNCIESDRPTETRRTINLWVSRLREHIYATSKHVEQQKDILNMTKKEIIFDHQQ